MSLWIIPQILMMLLGIPFVLITLYLLLLAIAAFLHPGKKFIRGVYQGERIPHTHFIIMVPAHNEELLLHDTIGHLHQMHYPADHYEIVVIADNCDDRTAEIATAAGATTLVRNQPDNRGKGQALNWAIQGPIRKWSHLWDALVVMDADSILSPDFLWFMDESLQQGHQAIQGYYGVLNPQEHWRTALMSAALSVFHFLRPLGRDRLGLPCGLKGNGMCFTRSIIERFGYPATSIVEDIELALIYLRHGIGVKFSPGAQVHAQMATSKRHTDTQRRRWEGGRLELVRQWAIPLLIEGFKQRNPAKLDAVLDLVIPPLSLLFLPTILGWNLMLLLLVLHPTSAEIIAFALWSTSLFCIIAYLISGLVLTGAPLVIWVQLSALPLFLFWKLASYFTMIAKRGAKASTRWTRTGRHEIK